MVKGQGRGGARKGAGRKSKTPYVKRKTGSWNVEEWIPQALQQLAKEKGLDSASDIVNEVLRVVCYLHGLQANDWGHSQPDPYQTGRWRFFSDDEMREVVDALSTRWHGAGNPPKGPLHDVWLSALQALEPQQNDTSWRHSVLDTPKEILPADPAPVPAENQTADVPAQSVDAAAPPPNIDFAALENNLQDFEQFLEQEDKENL